MLSKMLCDIDYRYSGLVDKRLISPEVVVIQLRMLSLYHEALYISILSLSKRGAYLSF